jgi:HEAT repeat protein/lysophospholipase L1-like esterase
MADRQARSPVPPLAQNLLLSAATVILVGGAAEAISRLRERGRAAPPPVAEYITDWDGAEFVTLQSAARGWPPWEHYNSDGVRDREHAVEKPPGVRRVVCLGDSVTLGYGIRPHDAWPQVLEDQLDARGRRTEVFNVAFGGWSTRQELIAYRRLARKYRPDQVILGVCLNDVPEMQNNLTRPPPLVRALYRRSALVRAVVGARRREIASVEELFRDPGATRVRDAFRLMFDDIRALEAEVGSDGGRLVVIVFPFRFQLRPGAPFPSAQREISRFCASEGIAFLDTLPALRPLGEDAFGDYDHFSPAGARRVAEAVADSGLLDVDDTANAERAPSPPAVAGAPGRPLPALLASLRAADPRERAAAARALGEIGPPARSATPSLVSRLDDEDESVRWRAGEALAAIGPEPSRCVEPLRRMAADPGRRGRAEAAGALGWIGPAAAPAVPALVSALADPRRDVRARSAWALGRIGPASAPAVPALIVMMHDPDNGWRAVDALGDIGPAAAAAEGALADALAQRSDSIRWRAAQALGRLGDAARPAGPALAHALEDRDDNVRLAAARALAQAGVDATVARAPLLGALSDTDSRVRAAAIRALHHLGPDPETARALEERARSDPDETVRAAARHALKPGRS